MEFCRGKQNLYFCNPKILHMKAEEPIAPYTSSLNSLKHEIINRVQASDDTERLYECLKMLGSSPVPGVFSEEELDEEISMSMKSGNASQEEIDMVFQRWAN